MQARVSVLGVCSSKLILITPAETGQPCMVCQSILTPTRANIREAISVTPPLEIEATSLMQTVTLRAAAAPVSAPPCDQLHSPRESKPIEYWPFSSDMAEWSVNQKEGRFRWKTFGSPDTPRTFRKS